MYWGQFWQVSGASFVTQAFGALSYYLGKEHLKELDSYSE